MMWRVVVHLVLRMGGVTDSVCCLDVHVYAGVCVRACVCPCGGGGMCQQSFPSPWLLTMCQDSWASQGKWWIRPQIYWLPVMWGSGAGVRVGGWSAVSHGGGVVVGQGFRDSLKLSVIKWMRYCDTLIPVTYISDGLKEAHFIQVGWHCELSFVQESWMLPI